MTDKITKNLIPLTIVISGLAIAAAIVYINPSFLEMKKENVLSPQEAGKKAIDYINQSILKGAATALLVNAVEENGVYKFHFKIENQEYDSYVTKDGNVLFIEAIKLEPTPTPFQEEENEEKPTTENTKRDVPDVKLFVMSYCPYGLQAQKALLPVYELLKDKAEIGVYFVNYIMHEKKEIDENLRQYCIQKEEREKYANYLSCFVKDGNYEKCLLEAKIDSGKLSSCISSTDKEYNIYSQYEDKSTWLNGQFPPFAVHLDLNEEYGVKGSPTIVINDQVVSISSRSPEKFKEAICQSFNSPPQECSQALSDTATSSGFGESASNSSGGGCGQ